MIAKDETAMYESQVTDCRVTELRVVETGDEIVSAMLLGHTVYIWQAYRIGGRANEMA